MRSAISSCRTNLSAALSLSGDPPLFAATYAENPGLVKALLQHGADIGQSNAKHQSLLEIVNPKSEIYRIVKNHMLSVPRPPRLCGGVSRLIPAQTPGGERKMKMASEDIVIATKPEVTAHRHLLHTHTPRHTQHNTHSHILCTQARTTYTGTLVAQLVLCTQCMPR